MQTSPADVLDSDEDDDVVSLPVELLLLSSEPELSAEVDDPDALLLLLGDPEALLVVGGLPDDDPSSVSAGGSSPPQPRAIVSAKAVRPAYIGAHHGM